MPLNNLSTFALHFASQASLQPWIITSSLSDILHEMIRHLSADYDIDDDIAIHKRCVVEDHSVLKGPLIISEGCFVAAYTYLRGGVFLGPQVTIGPGCEIKTSIVLDGSSLAHFNYVGDSIIGARVNMEAGSVIANHHNDRIDKRIVVSMSTGLVDTGCEKFGAVIGDDTKVGANAVISPGMIIPPRTIIPRLSLIK